jgi:hypothetical protein
MAETYSSLYIHFVFSTKDRQPTPRADVRKIAPTRAYLSAIQMRPLFFLP